MKTHFSRSIGLLFSAALAVALSACAGGQSAPPADSGGSGTGAPKVETLVVALASFPTESNKPHLVCCTSFLQLAPMYDFLTGVTPEGQELVPQLASEWKLEPDGKSFRFKLNKGIQFQNGRGEFTAKDVHYTWQDMVKETDIYPPQPTQVARQQIKDVEIINDYEVVIRLDQPNSGIMSAISQAESVLPIRSKVDGESRTRLPTMQDAPLAGTGPYQYVSRQQGQFLKFERAPGQHWRKTPDFPKLEQRIFKEASTMLASLLAKETQVAALPPELIPQAETAGFKAIAGKAQGLHAFVGFYGVWINKRLFPEEKLNPDPNAVFVNPNTPLLDVRVRKALNKAIDREALNKAFLRGKGAPIYVEYMNASRPGWNPDWEKKFKDAYGYDVEAAKKLLAEAGYGPSNPVNLSVRLGNNPYFPAIKDMNEAVGNYWRSVGVNVKLDTPDQVAITPKDRALESEDRATIVVTSIRQWLGPGIYNSNLNLTRGGAQFPALDAVYGEIRTTLDPKLYDERWRKWGDLAFDLYPNAPLYWIPSEAAVDPNIVADYPFPGSISSTYTHMDYIKAK